MKQNDLQPITERSCAPDSSTAQRQAALDSLKKLRDAVERFGKRVDEGTIAPPTSAGRWK